MDKPFIVIPKGEPPVLIVKVPLKFDSIHLTRDTAPMLLELLTKAAASGPDAAFLADLYMKAKAAADYFKGLPPAGAHET